jgi:predicted nucleic acid-binding protein
MLAACSIWSAHAHGTLIGEAYALRATHSVADAIYVALAEMLQAPLITCDGRQSRSHGHRADVVFVD